MALRRVHLSWFLVVLAQLLPGLPGQAQVLPLDHFKVYEVDPVPAPFPVRLTGQFDVEGVEGELREITHFANPTKKIHGANEVGIADPNRHLVWYVLGQVQPEPVRTIRYRNQFGLQSIDVHLPRFFLVPAQKLSDPGSEPPKEADHYKCYEVIRVNSVPPIPPIVLGDQFGTQDGVQVRNPRHFCLPVRKEREGHEPVGIFNPIDHLTVYDITPEPADHLPVARDQFGKWELKTSRSLWLAVPTEKLVVVPH